MLRAGWGDTSIRKISIYFCNCLLFGSKRVFLCFTPPENEFGDQLFLDSRCLVDFSTFSLVQARTSSYEYYESKKVSGRFPDEGSRTITCSEGHCRTATQSSLELRKSMSIREFYKSECMIGDQM